jgi:hypothetical protein
LLLRTRMSDSEREKHRKRVKEIIEEDKDILDALA